MSTDDDTGAIGKLNRQEILSFLMIVVFGGFVVIVFVIMYLILKNPQVVDTIIITGAVDLGMFVEKFNEILMAFLALLGVGVGVKIAKK